MAAPPHPVPRARVRERVVMPGEPETPTAATAVAGDDNDEPEEVGPAGNPATLAEPAAPEEELEEPVPVGSAATSATAVAPERSLLACIRRERLGPAGTDATATATPPAATPAWVSARHTSSSRGRLLRGKHVWICARVGRVAGIIGGQSAPSSLSTRRDTPVWPAPYPSRSKAVSQRRSCNTSRMAPQIASSSWARLRLPSAVPTRAR